MSEVEGNDKQCRERRQKGLFAAAWDWFGAIRVAIILFIIWASLSALATLIPQGEPASFYLQKYGDLPGRLLLSSYVGLDHAYTSPAYKVVLALFLGSIHKFLS